MEYSRLALFILAIVSTTNSLEEEHIHTKLGDVIGVVEHVRNEKVYQFRNIPYAKPPVGDLRFAKPEKKGSWSGILDATRFGPSCLQPTPPLSFQKYIPNLNQSEDCLVLNIYVPRDMASTTKRSVMVWIHGGGYFFGQGMYYDGSYLALTGDVVVVTINYRLGLFGFLSTPDAGGLQGNYGLWDQHMALQWVKENINDYGGNPNSVTIFGESAGAFSVGLHALVPQNQGLFQRVIAQSGSALSSFSHLSLSERRATAQFVGMKVGCVNASGISATYAECISRKSVEDLLAAQNALILPSLEPLKLTDGLGPVIDNNFLQSSPEDLLKNKTSGSFQFFRNLDFMTGNTNAEGSIFLGILTLISKHKKFNFSVGIPTDVFCDYIVPSFVNYYFNSQVNSTLPNDLICSLYGTSNKGQEGDNAIDVFSDAFFVAPTIKSLMTHSEGNVKSSTYQYIFKRPVPDTDFSVYPPWWRNDSSAHAAELPFLFGLEDFPTKYNISVSQDDVNLSKAMQKYWTNFAKTGNPNSDDVPVWGVYDTVQQSYIDLDTTITTGHHLYGEWISLWLDRLPKLLNTQDPDGAIGK